MKVSTDESYMYISLGHYIGTIIETKNGKWEMDIDTKVGTVYWKYRNVNENDLSVIATPFWDGAKGICIDIDIGGFPFDISYWIKEIPFSVRYKGDIYNQHRDVKNYMETVKQLLHEVEDFYQTIQEYIEYDGWVKQPEPEPREAVNLIASGYEWTCPDCGALYRISETADEVYCQNCNELFEVSGCEHANPW